MKKVSQMVVAHLHQVNHTYISKTGIEGRNVRSVRVVIKRIIIECGRTSRSYTPNWPCPLPVNPPKLSGGRGFNPSNLIICGVSGPVESGNSPGVLPPVHSNSGLTSLIRLGRNKQCHNSYDGPSQPGCPKGDLKPTASARLTGHDCSASCNDPSQRGCPDSVVRYVVIEALNQQDDSGSYDDPSQPGCSDSGITHVVDTLQSAK